MSSSDGNILTYAAYGTALVPSNQLALARGSGNWNPSPVKIQSTNRGPEQKNAFPMYLEKQGKKPEAMDVWNMGAADYTIVGQNDLAREQMYTVGSTGLHSENPGSWTKALFNENQYVEWALSSLKMTSTPLIEYFFSTDNINYLQKQTINEVRRISGETVNEQSVDALLIIMRNHIIYAYSGWLGDAENPNKITNRGEKR